MATTFFCGQAQTNYSVDRDNGTIKGLSVATIGKVLGHGGQFDQTTLAQILEGFANRKVKARFGHMNRMTDPIGEVVGYFTNARISGEKLLADFVAVPTNYNQKAIDHLFKFAELSPDIVGLSIEANVGSERIKGTQDFAHRVNELFAVAFTSDPSANPSGLFKDPQTNSHPQTTISKIMNPLMRLFKALTEQTNYAEAELAGGEIVRYPGETPQIGDPIMLVEDGEEVGSAPDGVHTIGGVDVTVSDGIITGIAMSGDDETESEDIEASNPDASADASPDKKKPEETKTETDKAEKGNGKQYRTPKTPKRLAKPKKTTPMPTNFEDKQRIEKLEKMIEAMAGQPADQFDPGKVESFSIGSQQTKKIDAIKDGFVELQKHKQSHYDAGTKPTFRKLTRDEKYSFNPAADLIPALVDFDELKTEFRYRSPLEDIFTFVRLNVGGDTSATLTLPTLSDTSAGTRIIDGQTCSPTATGEVSANGRDLVVRPWSNRMTFCPRDAEFQRFLDRAQVVSLENIPFEALFIDTMLNRIGQDWDISLYIGNGGAMTGIITTMLADANVVGSPASASPSTYTEANFVPGTAVAEMESIAQDIPARIRQMGSQMEIAWALYGNDLQTFVYDRGVEPNANAELSDLVLPPLVPNARFRADWNLQDPTAGPPAEFYHFVSPRENLYIGTSDQDPGLFDFNMVYDSVNYELHFDTKGHVGAQYARSEDVFMSVGS